MSIDIMTAGALVLVVVLAVILFLLIRHRTQAPEARLAAVGADLLTQVLIPDGDGGEIHLEYVLLCPRGILVLNIKEAHGNVFGSDSMNEWTVITGKSRYTFRNPQEGLFDRMAAVKRLVSDVPVLGYIAFMPGADFSKGRPGSVVMLEALLDELEAEKDNMAATAAFHPEWDRLKEAARPADAS